MADYFDEVADMMASSWTVGRWCSREQIAAALRGKFANEDELRAEVMRLKAQVLDGIEKAEAAGFTVVGIAQEERKEH